ncbi:hypothetical protein C900_02429 [Fulvivirga imtechensis AK7]|uniref:ABM domain-containing protein n=2 Tax=Fulvivirga TaxID=396811 RepID=L8JRM1_9BACT|nr:hypothetical protein C900_02429 [Fulvivirga imtechensis AK7]
METTAYTVRENKELIEKLNTQSLNKRDFELLNNIIADDYMGINGQKGVEAFKAPAIDIISTIPDIQWQIETMAGEGNMAFAKLQIYGTHTGSYLNIEPTGKTISINSVAIYQFRDNRIISSEVQVDRLTFLQQIGIVPDLSLIEKKIDREQVVFIDKFLVPADAEAEFVGRMNANRKLIRKLPGFVEDAVCKNTDNNGNRIYLTVAKWESEAALNNAKEVVQTAYRKEGFDPGEMMKRLNITMDRRTYIEVENELPK